MTPPDVSSALGGAVTSAFGGQMYIGIILALLSGVVLSLGTQLQHRGVAVVDERHAAGAKQGVTLGHIKGLFARPSWLFGTLLLGLAVVLQLTSLWFAPITVVQPLGAIGLVVTAILNARLSHTRLGGKVIGAIVLCIAGVGLFVTFAALYARLRPVSSGELTAVLVALTVALIVWGVLYLFLRRKPRPLFYILAAGTLFGFIATLAKVVIGRVQTLIDSGWQFGAEEWLTILCLVGLLLATLLGSWFVQNAHMYGPPDLVVAGLTVFDPIVAVTIGGLVLGELQGAPLWALLGMLVMGIVAIIGVYQLARQHPQMLDGSYDTGPVRR